MDQQERAFLNAALGVGDARLERRLLVGFHLLRDCCRIAEDDEWTPRPAHARRELDALKEDAAKDDPELHALEQVLIVLESEQQERGALYSAVFRYGRTLLREGWYGIAGIVFEVVERLWTPDCPTSDWLQATYLHSLTVVRGANAKDVKSEMPIVLAQRARAVRSREYVGAARVIDVDNLLYAGNLPLSLRKAEHLLEWLERSPSLSVESAALLRISVIHGRAGRFDETVRFADRVLDPRFHIIARFSALNLVGVAFMDLGDYAAAEAAFELMLLATTSLNRFLGWLGLLDLYARRGQREEFERIYDRLVPLPLLANSRVHLFQSAGRGWARLGEIERARAAFNAAQEIARQYAYNYEIIETDELLASLDAAAAPVPLAPSTGGVVSSAAAHVTALRDAQAREIAECLA